MSSEDPRPLEDLLDAAGRAAQPTHPGWQSLAERLAQTAQAPPRRRWRWYWLAPAPLAAAAAVAFFVLSDRPIPFLNTGGNQVQAAEEPIRVERQDVQLTVLSVAETEGETLYMPIMQKLAPHLPGTAFTRLGMQAAMEWERVQQRRAMFGGAPPRRTGQALVKDRRIILNLKEGDNLVRFTDVAASIDPTSVRFKSDTDPDGTVVVEQNFEYDLASADSLLKRYLDRKISCIGKKDNEVTTGFLASYDEASIVLASEPPPSPSEPRKPRSTQTLARAVLQAIRLDEVPAGLLVKPTLVWKLRAKRPGKHETTLTYLCGMMKWQADYVAVVTPGEGKEPDLLDLTGWVTLENTSGATYEKAVLKLIAGDVNRVRDPWAPPPPQNEWANESDTFGMTGMLGAGMNKESKKEFVEKSFFEYHLYTLTAPSTVRNQEVKQLSLMRRTGVKAQRRYVFDPSLDGRQLAIELVAKNEKENNLGLPLPKGRVTLEQRDTDGETGLAGRAEIDHTAVKEELTLRYGFAFDVAGESKQVKYVQVTPQRYVVTQEVRVRNHKTTEIQVRVIARLGRNWTITESTLPFKPHDFATVHFDFALKPNAEKVLTYVVDYQN